MAGIDAPFDGIYHYDREFGSSVCLSSEEKEEPEGKIPLLEFISSDYLGSDAHSGQPQAISDRERSSRFKKSLGHFDRDSEGGRVGQCSFYNNVSFILVPSAPPPPPLGTSR